MDITTGNDLGLVTLVGNTASVTVSSLVAGSHTIKPTYGGDGNFHSSTSFAGATVSVVNSIYVLNPTASRALDVAGTASVTTPGLVQVDSSSTSAVVASGSAKVAAGSIQVVGGVSVSRTASLKPTPATGTKPVADPFAAVGIPALGTAHGAVNLSGSSALTINPGVYTSINVSGNASLTLTPGIYEIVGGGFTVSGGGRVTGKGVVIYNAGKYFPNSGGTFGAISFSATANVQLTAASTGPYTGIVIFQARDNAQTITLGGSTMQNLTGAIYAPAALLSVAGSVQLPQTSLVVNELLFQASTGTSPGAMGLSAMGSTPQGPLGLATNAPLTQVGTGGGIVSLGQSASSSKSGRASGPSSAVVLTPADLATRGTSSPWTVAVRQGGPDPNGEELFTLIDPEVLNELAIGVAGNQQGGPLSARSKPRL